jgi:hypothetical protein
MWQTAKDAISLLGDLGGRKVIEPQIEPLGQ